ncbi:MAG: GAF domain-containing protein [Actinomycetes bacterium]
MNSDRVAELLRTLGPDDDADTPLIERLCRLCVGSIGVDGVGLSVSAGVGKQFTVAATDATSQRVEEMQVLFGEGPCIDAMSSGAPVLVGDLTRPPLAERWPAFTPAARNAGVRATFAFPLQIGAIRLGAMDLYRDRTGSLEHDDLVEARSYADAAVRVILDLHTQGGDGELPDALAPGWSSSSAVHQATGMIMVQLGTDLVSAFAALRARAFRSDRRVQDVARDVVERRLQFDER